MKEIKNQNGKIQQNSEIQNLMKFLDKSVTNYHAVQEVCTQLDEQGFVQLSEKNCGD